MQNKIDYELINELYMEWINEQDASTKEKIKEEIKQRISPDDFLMYSIRFSNKFEAFKNIFSLADLFKVLETMEENGTDITNITNQILLIENSKDISDLNEFSKKTTSTQIKNFRLKIEANSLFENGDIKNIGKKFPYACVNLIDIELVEQLLRNEKDYKGVPIIITIDNIGELPLNKLSNIQEKFNVIGIRIKSKDVKISEITRPISLEDYKKIRTIVDKEIIGKINFENTEKFSKQAKDIYKAVQIIYLIVDRIKYDKDFKEKKKESSLDEAFCYYSNVSNMLGVITGKTVCAGYSEILRNILSCADINCKTIVGKTSSNNFHAWNQIQLGDMWFNADITWAAEEIIKGEPSGYLFMSDAIFFGDKRYVSLIQLISGGHKEAFNTNSEKCDSYMSPHTVAALIRKVKEDKEKFENLNFSK